MNFFAVGEAVFSGTIEEKLMGKRVSPSIPMLGLEILIWIYRSENETCDYLFTVMIFRPDFLC